MSYYHFIVNRRSRRAWCTPAGELTTRTCDICGADCTVACDNAPIRIPPINAPVLAERHDRWFCPRDQFAWHRQLEELIGELQKLSSSSLRRLVQRDIDDLKNRHAVG